MSSMQVIVPRNPALVIPESPVDLVRAHVGIDARHLPLYLNRWNQFWQCGYIEDLQILPTCLAREVPMTPNALARFLINPGVAVYACSKEGHDPAYKAAAFLLGQEVARAGLNLFYGGGNSGLMGATKDGFISVARLLGNPHQYAVQIFPACFTGYAERVNVNGYKASNEGLCNTADAAVITTNGLGNRGAGLMNMALGVIPLPGSLGTTQEFATDLLSAKTGRRANPVVLVNFKGYYDNFLAHTRHILDEGMDCAENAHLLHVAKAPAEAVQMMLDLWQAKGLTPTRERQDRILLFDREIWQTKRPDPPRGERHNSYVVRSFREMLGNRFVVPHKP